MTDQHPENNQVLHELFGKCWHEPHRPDLWEYYRCRHCKREYSYNEITYAEYGNPDYAADPRLVLGAMKEKNRLGEFLIFLCRQRITVPEMSYRIDVDPILDQTGRLRDWAIEFMKEEGK